MRVTCAEQEAPTAQVLCDSLNTLIADMEADTYALEDIMVFLGQVRSFMEENHEVV